MKKILPLIVFCCFVGMAHAQWLPINTQITFTQYNYFTTSLNSIETVVNDSMIYIMDFNGIETLNINTGQTTYKFTGVYYVNMIKPDTGGGLLLVKNDTVLLRYHYPADTFETIPLPAAGLGITDVASSTGYTWALFNNSIVGRYDGQTWILDSMVAAGGKLLVKNDSTAYILALNASHLYSLSSGGFNYNFAQLNSVRTNDPMDIDTTGNVWIADSTNLFKVSPTGTVTALNSSVDASYPSLPLNVQCDKLGNVWVSGAYDYMYNYNGVTWTAYAGQMYNYTAYTAIDKNSGRFYDFVWGELIIFNNGTQSYMAAPNMPYSNMSAMNGYYIATNQGIFQFNSFSPYAYNNNFPMPLDFIDTSALNPYIHDVTCLVNGNNMTHIDTTHAFLYGTHHGVYGLNGLIDNTQLPDTNINYIYYEGGSIYIGTDMGLCIFKNGTYIVFDTSNSPLPSNKITYLTNASTLYSGLTDTALYVGTDKGLAIYDTSGWRIFDTAYFHISNVYVTGVVPAGSGTYDYNPYYSTIFVSTLGSGLIALQVSGTYSIYDSANGYLTNDTVYNVSMQDFLSCGEDLVVAIPGAGLAYQDVYNQNIIPFTDFLSQQVTLSDTEAFKYYATLNNYYSAMSIFSQATGSVLGTAYGGCVGIKDIPAPQQQLKWNYESNTLRVWLPGTYTGPCTLNVYDLQGQLAASIKTNVNTNAIVPINASQFANGFYVVQANLNGTVLQCKTVVDR